MTQRKPDGPTAVMESCIRELANWLEYQTKATRTDAITAMVVRHNAERAQVLKSFGELRKLGYVEYVWGEWASDDFRTLPLFYEELSHFLDTYGEEGFSKFATFVIAETRPDLPPLSERMTAYAKANPRAGADEILRKVGHNTRKAAFVLKDLVANGSLRLPGSLLSMAR